MVCEAAFVQEYHSLQTGPRRAFEYTSSLLNTVSLLTCCCSPQLLSAFRQLLHVQGNGCDRFYWLSTTFMHCPRRLRLFGSTHSDP